MFWPYFFPWVFNSINLPYYETATQTLGSPSIPSVTEQLGAKLEFNPLEQENINIPSSMALPFKIDLTREELLTAGYEVGKKSWTEEEDRKLKMLVKKRKKDWIKISKGLPGRNQKMCYSRYRRLKSSSRNYWKKTQDQKILYLVKEIGENWKQISTHFQNRTSKQLKERYLNNLHPQVNKSQWTLQDDEKLIQLLNKYGKNWGVIQQNMEGRSVIQLKNRFFGRIKKLMENKLLGIKEQ